MKHKELKFSMLPGVLAVDQTLQVLLSTGVFVGGALAIILDNTVPGGVVTDDIF